MSLYRGAGGASDATDDSTVNAVAGYASSAAASAATATTAATSADASATEAIEARYQAEAATGMAAIYSSSAQISANSAGTNAVAANVSKNSASTSATNASTSASTASSFATYAASSASRASTSATAAAASATAAATSKTGADSAAASALAIYGNTAAMNTAVAAAATSATNAATSATNAASSATTASNAASTANLAVTTASGWATTAQNAANSADADSTSATNSANTATAQASTATTKAAEAAASAVAAANSASSASTVSGSGNGVFGATPISTASTLTLSGGTANGVAYLNGSKVLTTGSALTFDGTNFGVGAAWTTNPLRSTQPQFFQYGAASSALTLASDGAATVQVLRFTSSSAGPAFSAGKARGTYASPTAVASGDSLLNINMQGYGGTTARTLVQISGVVDTYTSDTNISSYLTFGVSPSGAAASAEGMRLTSTGLGIGTSSPVSALTLANAKGLTWPNAAGSFSATAGNQIVKASDNNLYFDAYDGAMVFRRASYAETMRLDASGNLGLGVTPSAWSVGKAFQLGAAGDVALWDGNGGVVRLMLNSYYNGGYKYKTTAAASQYEQYNGAHAWFRAASGPAGDPITFIQAMTLDASGNLGIGTTSPAAKRLHAANLAAGSGIRVSGPVGDNNWAGGIEFYSDNATTVTSSILASSGGLLFSYGGSERARIDSSGNLLVGTTQIANGTKFVVLASNNVAEFRTSATAADMCTFYTSNTTTYAGKISASSNVTLYQSASDYRLKNIDGPVTNSGAFIDNLNPVQGSWKADGSRFIGFLAHELQEASETVVGTGVKDGEEMQSIDHSNAELIANLVAELQSLRKRFAILESK
jgi:hypothetical protein